MYFKILKHSRYHSPEGKQPISLFYILFRHSLTEVYLTFPLNILLCVNTQLLDI